MRQGCRRSIVIASVKVGMYTDLMIEANVIIIGGGPAGLAAAAFSEKAYVLERLPRPGTKLLATGGGRCNITHDAEVDEIVPLFGKHGRFITPAVRAWPPSAIREFLHEWKVPTVVDADGCVFPASGQASHVRDALVAAAQAAGAEIHCDVRVKRIRLNGAGDCMRGVETDTGAFIPARVVILAAGGQSYPKLGSDGSSFALAEEIGLAVTPRYPALAALVTVEKWGTALAGIACPNASLRLTGKGFSREPVSGPILFTHKGLSGPPALALSGTIAQARHETGQPVAVAISFLADRRHDDWIACFDAWRQASGARRVRLLLGGEIPKALAEQVCRLAGIGEETTAAQLTRDEAKHLAEHCVACPLTVTATDGWDRAMLTRGGIALSELTAKTLACKRIAGLYCVGECVDLDAPCGGYNLTWALASGRLAAESARRHMSGQAPRPAAPQKNMN